MSVGNVFLWCLSCIIVVQCQQENPIKHLIILMMENRSFDHYLGFLKTLNPEINGLNGDEYNCVIPDNTSSTCITVNTNGYDMGPSDPDHSYGGTIVQIYGHGSHQDNPGIPKMDGFVYSAFQDKSNISNPLSMFTINNNNSYILNTLAMEYGIFDNWFCSVPGPTDPNRAFAMSGTSNGMVQDYNGTQWNQQSYMDLLGKNNISWSGYWDQTIWEFGAFEDLTRLPNSKNIYPLTQFYQDLQGDDLASFIWLQPSPIGTKEYGPANWQHPDNPVHLGEILIQQIYESLKNSSYWNSSALIITYDEHGGFYDHVPPPHENVPNPDGVNATNGFTFDRLGIRIPTVVISPWINKGTVIHNATNGPTPTSQYEGTSNIATANKLFNLDKYLGERHKWSATYDDIFLQRKTPRTDAPQFPSIKQWTMEDVESQSIKPINNPLKIQVEFMCDQLHIKTCPQFKTQGEASQFLVEMTPIFMRKIQS